MDIDLAQRRLAVDLDGDRSGIDQLLQALAVTLRDNAIEIIDAMRLVLDRHPAFAFFCGQALRYGVLRPGPRDGAIDGGAVYGHGDQAAVCGEPGAALGRDRGSCRRPAEGATGLRRTRAAAGLGWR